VQFGIRDIFDKAPPLDVNSNGDTTYYLSPYGDMRLRSYWLSLRKEF
jgi:outer membrane receptor protein involved in Fe transport